MERIVRPEWPGLKKLLYLRAAQGGAGESNVYIPNLTMAYLQDSAANHYIGASSNTSRVTFFGKGTQAGQYTTRNNSDTDYRLPVIKLPRNTASITISFTDTTRLYNDSYAVVVLWTKDIPAGSGETVSYCVYYVSKDNYNPKANNNALIVNTLDVPSDVDSFVGLFWLSSAIAEGETPYTIAEDTGFSITFNTAPLVEHTVTGNPVTFTASAAKPILGLKTDFTLIQAGSGDPSPDNVRTITGWDGLGISCNDIDYDWEWEVAGDLQYTVGSGHFDAFAENMIVADYILLTFDGSEASWSFTENSGYNELIWPVGWLPYAPDTSSAGNLICNYFKLGSTAQPWYAYIAGTGNLIFFVDPETIPTKNAWLAYLAEHNLQAAYKLAQPHTEETGPMPTISTVAGQNRFSSTSNGDLTVTYLSRA